MTGLVHDLCGDSLPRTCLVAGGGSNAGLWTTLLEQALDHPLTITQADPLTGAARMAQSALDQIGDHP